MEIVTAALSSITWMHLAFVSLVFKPSLIVWNVVVQALARFASKDSKSLQDVQLAKQAIG